ncbi:MAG: hypothetical protein MSH18_00960 [Bacteroidales bacterium]|nr:hypothetical protein [Bacteroidales bacterium]
MKYGGHVITAERLADGRMMYYDAQSDTFLKIEEYAARDVEYFEVLISSTLSTRWTFPAGLIFMICGCPK